MIQRKTLTLLGIIALLGALGLFSVGAVFAQTGTPGAQATPGERQAPLGKAFGRGFGFFGGQGVAAFDAAAKALNLTPTQLFEQLHNGKTLQEIATAQGVDLQQVRDAVQAVQAQAVKDRIAAAVKNGAMTQDQADWLLQGIEKGYMGKGGFGFGGRMHGGRGLKGMPGLQQPAPAPSATPSVGTTG